MLELLSFFEEFLRTLLGGLDVPLCCRLNRSDRLGMVGRAVCPGQLGATRSLALLVFQRGDPRLRLFEGCGKLDVGRRLISKSAVQSPQWLAIVCAGGQSVRVILGIVERSPLG